MMTDKRKTNLELPDATEFMSIISKEAERQVDPSKKDQHFVNFYAVKQLARALDLPAVWLEPPKTGNMYERAVWVLNMGASWVEQVSNRGLDGVGEELRDTSFNYLSESDTPQRVDFLIVMGGKSLSRPQKAAELYKDGVSTNIIVTGHGPSYADGNHMPEWRMYQEELLRLDVSPSAIIVEPHAVTTPDCAFRTLNLLDAEYEGYKSLGIITSNWNLRRGSAHFIKMSPPGVNILRFGSGTLPETSRYNWFKNKDSIKIILNEYVKMRASHETNTI